MTDANYFWQRALSIPRAVANVATPITDPRAVHTRGPQKKSACALGERCAGAVPQRNVAGETNSLLNIAFVAQVLFVDLLLVVDVLLGCAGIHHFLDYVVGDLLTFRIHFVVFVFVTHDRASFRV
jgi:hypothetical protein